MSLSKNTKTQIRQSFEEFKNNMPNFVLRPVQNKMIAEISKTLGLEYKNKNPILCVEAPTGIGKTFAYLLGAIPIAINSKKKLIISSANVALQEQLLFKDIPEAQKYSTVDFEYVLVKGRSRYLCVRNLINLTQNDNQEQLFESAYLWNDLPGESQLNQLNDMLDDYSNKRYNGEIDALDNPPDKKIWQKICCNRWTCSARNCEFYSDCAFFKARKKIYKADVIIANHDLVLADLSTGNTVLPEVENSIFIFDEAHHLNQKALSHFSLNSSFEHIKTTTRQVRGISEQISKLTKQTLTIDNIKKTDDCLSDLTAIFKNLDFDEDNYIFEKGFIDKDIKTICTNLLNIINSTLSKFTKLKDLWTDYLKIETLDKNITNQLNNVLGECEQHLSTIILLFTSFLQIDKDDQPPIARWLEKSILANKKTNYHLNSAKIDISNNLNKIIWSRVAGAILTSATLSSLGSFDRLNSQLGLTREENQYLRLPSPFNFDKVDFIVAKFKNSPQQVYEHTQEVAVQLLKRVNPKKGSLVLFASNKQMQLVADLVDKKLGCGLFVQGEYSKKLILEKHINLRKQGKGSVIFGLDSFSEGVDLKADNLTHVIIVKLRFSVPTSPIEKTRADYLETQNRNSFMEISLPDAALKLIQACGRLIRTETDTGKITIFDNRLVSKFYGKKLLNSLPGYNIVIE